MSHKATAIVGDKHIHIETGKLAKQADGAVTIQLGETIILTAAVGAIKAKEGQEFFPLTVDYRERSSAAGKFPGGFFKREGRPSEKEILTCRLTDRPIRPLFPKGWYNEVQVQTILISADQENDSDILSIIAASAALSVSDIPWDGPLGAVRVGRINGQLVANPTHAERALSDLDLVYVGSATDVVMIEGSAKEISEADFTAALRFGQDCCQPIIAAQKELIAKAGKKKREITLNLVPDDILAEAKALAGDRMAPALLIPGKLAREAACRAIQNEVGEKLKEKHGVEKITNFTVSQAFYYIQKETMRSLIMTQGKRLDGRGPDDMRALTSEVGMIPRTHGSGLFSRGETQALALVTLGTTDDAQDFDAYTGGVSSKKFMLHYNFPNFSVGETGRIMGPGRREIGHGALAERSIEPMLPLATYPYAVRITSEIMESNGSTSMASICAGTLALLDAGVPLIRPVAGISVGLCSETDDNDRINEYRLLTDIIGWEDAFGDMDCKFAGTENGITGFQLDLKLRGLPIDILAEALEKARIARLTILENMKACIAEPRKELSKYAPRIVQIKINPEKIGALIGPGGKNIKRLVEESGCEINIEDDGTVNVYSTSAEGMEIARREIEGMSAEIEVGKNYRGRVVTIKEFGCFVEFLPGQDGLVHISELANFRVKMTEDIVKMGDEIWVKCLGVDEKGRVKLSRRAAMAERDAEHGGTPAGEAPPEGSQPDVGHRPEPGDRGGDRGEPRGGDRGGRGGDRGGRGGDRGGRGGDRGGRGGDRGPRPEGRGEHGGDRGPRPANAPAPGGHSHSPADQGNAGGQH